MKCLIAFLLPIFSFAQQKDSVKVKSLSKNLNQEIRQSFKKDSLKVDEFNMNNYRKEAIRERRKRQREYDDENFRKDHLRQKLLENNQSKGGKVID